MYQMRIVGFIEKQVPFIVIMLLSFIGYLANINYDYQKNLKTGTYRRLLTSYDVTSNTFLPYEIIINKRINFGEETLKAIKAVEGTLKPHSITKVGDKYYSSYPIVAGLLAVPIYYLPLVLHKVPTLLYREDFLKILLLGRISASFYTAVSVGLFFLILKNLLNKLNLPFNKWSYLFVVFYAFGTNVYSIASRGLWQHTSSILINSLIILLLVYALDRPKIVGWVGFLCGLSFIARPTNIFFVLAIAVYVFFKYRRESIRFILSAGIMACILATYYFLIYGSPFTNEYIVKQDTSFSTPLLTGLFGNLFSPARSFLFITPPLVLSYYGIFYYLFKNKKQEVDEFLNYLSISFIFTLMVLSMWWCWYGADRFGYGLLTEWMPIIVILTYLISQKLGNVLKILLIILMLYSFYTQINAVWFRKSRCRQDHAWTFYCIEPVLDRQDY
jgi:hypothetical protein